MAQTKGSTIKIDLRLFQYLQRFNGTVEALDEAFIYLIQSLSGDQYYLCEWLPEMGRFSVEFGEEIYGMVGDMTGTEIFELRNAVIDGLEDL